MKPKTIDEFNKSQSKADEAICDRLREVIDQRLPEAESKIWHAHPVWFLDDNPIVGYSKLKCLVAFFNAQSPNFIAM